MIAPGATATFIARLSQRLASLRRDDLHLLLPAHFLSKNSKTNPTPIPTFLQATITTRLRRTHSATLPNQADKAGSRQYQTTQNPDSKRTQTRLLLTATPQLPIASIEPRSRHLQIANQTHSPLPISQYRQGGPGETRGLVRGALRGRFCCHTNYTTPSKTATCRLFFRRQRIFFARPKKPPHSSFPRALYTAPPAHTLFPFDRSRCSNSIKNTRNLI